MPRVVELNLALILFLPWYLVLGWMFMRYVRGAAWSMRLVAFATITVALVAAAFTGVWAYHHADPTHGALWTQILPAVIGYGAFLAVIVIGFVALRAMKRHR